MYKFDTLTWLIIPFSNQISYLLLDSNFPNLFQNKPTIDKTINDSISVKKIIISIYFSFKNSIPRLINIIPANAKSNDNIKNIINLGFMSFNFISGMLKNILEIGVKNAKPAICKINKLANVCLNFL